MTNMRMAITPKSDQLNFDDFTGGQSKTIKINKVSIGKHEQPVAIGFEGDNGKPWKPCKSMCRVLVHCWGDDANLYTGRSLTLYGDPSVIFGGQKVGGIRISHMSHIDKEITLSLTTTRASRKPFTVRPLVSQDVQDAPPSIDNAFSDLVQEANGAAERGTPVLMSFWNRITSAQQKSLAHMKEALKARAAEVDESNREPSNPLMAG